MIQFLNGLILLLLFFGISQRRNRKIHIPIMITCFCADMTSVIYLELKENVIAKAYEHVNQFSMDIHLTFAIVTLIGYGVAIFTGRKLNLFYEQYRKIHKTNMFIFLIARTGVFITSFIILPGS